MTPPLHQQTTDASLNLPVGVAKPTGGSMAKYSADQLRALLKKGQAMANAAGEPSYPVADAEDLANAIRGVGRGGKSSDSIRKYIIGRAREMGKSDAIPDTWSADGSLKQEDAAPVYDGDYRIEADGTRVYDPDHDGDDDSTAEGDTDHDYVLPDGTPTPRARRAQQDSAMRSEGRTLSTVLLLEGEIPGAVVLQEATPDNGNKMRVRVPFYVSESIARAPGFDRRVYFPRSLLPSIVQEGKRQIAEGKQPLTVYARHAHAMSGDHLPVGAVVDLEQEGRIGYATLEVSPTEGSEGGRNVQILASNKHLNAVSLRSGLGRFELEDKTVNGEQMLTPKRLALTGVDFAPDSPAQPTFGIQILSEDARVEPPPPTPIAPPRRTEHVPDTELTLGDLRRDHAPLMSEIEAPLRRDLAALTTERDTLKTERATLQQERDTLAAERDTLVNERNARLRNEKLADIAAQFPDPAAALPVLQELCKDCQTDDQVSAKAFPILLEALSAAKTRQAETKPPREALLDLFRIGGAGQPGLDQENPDKPRAETPDAAAMLGGVAEL